MGEEPTPNEMHAAEQTGLIAHTHILNVTSHCKNKKIDEAVQNQALTSNAV